MALLKIMALLRVRYFWRFYGRQATFFSMEKTAGKGQGEIDSIESAGVKCKKEV
jgi:hypothetical protein